MTAPPETPPLPSWADPSTTWAQLIDVLRFWLRPDDALLSDGELMILLLGADSMAHAVIDGWKAKIRLYGDPNRLIRSQIGTETMQWPSPDDLIKWARDVLADLENELGKRQSRILHLPAPPQVFGVTPYRLTPGPELLPPEGSGASWSAFDLSRGKV